MTAKEFILKKLNECVLFTHEDYPESVFHIWDKMALRQKKLSRLSKNSDIINFKPNKNSVLLFEQDYKNESFWYDYNNIYRFLIDEYNLNEDSINKFIKEILNENKMRSLTPDSSYVHLSLYIDENKMSSLTPEWSPEIFLFDLEDSNKMKLLTPKYLPLRKDYNKMSLLTPFSIERL